MYNDRIIRYIFIVKTILSHIEFTQNGVAEEYFLSDKSYLNLELYGIMVHLRNEICTI